jgi:cellulose synthase/poly-beta-1,6-N-acetylglucosamine synthase-like glycosyltransferase
MLDMTVLLACKDREYNLQYCLKSISLSSELPKVILVDFGSKNSLERYMEQYPEWLTVVRASKSTGFFHKARALNIGLRRVKTQFVCATDVDQVFNPNFFEKIFCNLMKCPKIFIMCKTFHIRNFTLSLKEYSYGKLLDIAKKQTKRVYGEGCCNSVETEWLKSVRGWDENYIGWGAEDSDLMLRARFSKFKVIWMQNLTNMIHLPHSKNAIYYSNIYTRRNRQYLSMRRRKPSDIIVNKNKNWGSL